MKSVWRKVAMGVVLLIIIRICIGETGCVPSESMTPTLLSGDCIWVDKVTYGARFPARWSDIPILNVFTWIKPLRIREQSINWGYGRMYGVRKPMFGDIVVFNNPEKRSMLLVKRITNMLHAGDTLRFQPDNCKFYKNILAINGQTLYKRGDQLYINERADSIYVLSENCYFVEGDNKDKSSDSRTFGYIPERYIVGKVGFVLFSFDSTRHYLPQIRFNRIARFVK